MDEGVVNVFGVDGGRSGGRGVELRNARRELRERRWERVDLRDAKDGAEDALDAGDDVSEARVDVAEGEKRHGLEGVMQGGLGLERKLVKHARGGEVCAELDDGGVRVGNALHEQRVLDVLDQRPAVALKVDLLVPADEVDRVDGVVHAEGLEDVSGERRGGAGNTRLADMLCSGEKDERLLLDAAQDGLERRKLARNDSVLGLPRKRPGGDGDAADGDGVRADREQRRGEVDGGVAFDERPPEGAGAVLVGERKRATKTTSAASRIFSGSVESVLHSQTLQKRVMSRTLHSHGPPRRPNSFLTRTASSRRRMKSTRRATTSAGNVGCRLRTISSSSAAVIAATLTTVKRLRNERGRPFRPLPSAAGFCVAKRQKFGWQTISRPSSGMKTVRRWSSSALRPSRTLCDARFRPSSRSQFPRRTASTSTPSWKTRRPSGPWT